MGKLTKCNLPTVRLLLPIDKKIENAFAYIVMYYDSLEMHTCVR